ncbi:hypothetical protein [Winogradskyella sp. R77965]|uniref:hypothetical protein n=1 Tax=Winogradskyella sp. R77965 TaxID=3093872 RepID=UPI0037DD3647
MEPNYLLPNKYKIPGWLLLISGIIGGMFLIASDFESDILQVKVLALYDDNSFLSNQNGQFFKIIENSILDEIIALFIIIGGLLVSFSREKVEDEFIYKLRKDSFVWAMIFNYLILMLAIVFVYNLSFFNVLVYNMFTPLLFFIARFNFLKSRV